MTFQSSILTSSTFGQDDHSGFAELGGSIMPYALCPLLQSLHLVGVLVCGDSDSACLELSGMFCFQNVLECSRMFYGWNIMECCQNVWNVLEGM